MPRFKIFRQPSSFPIFFEGLKGFDIRTINAILWSIWTVSGLAHLLYEGDPENSQENLEYDLQFEGYGKSKAGCFTSSTAPHKLMIQLSWKTGPES
jgi:hypothetical protein